MPSFQTYVTLVDDVDANELLVEVTYDIYGEYRAATWGYYGGEPAEEPEMTILEITVVEDYAEGGYEEGFELDTDELEGAGFEELAWKDARAV